MATITAARRASIMMSEKEAAELLDEWHTQIEALRAELLVMISQGVDSITPETLASNVALLDVVLPIPNGSITIQNRAILDRMLGLAELMKHKPDASPDVTLFENATYATQRGSKRNLGKSMRAQIRNRINVSVGRQFKAAQKAGLLVDGALAHDTVLEILKRNGLLHEDRHYSRVVYNKVRTGTMLETEDLDRKDFAPS